jgi:hypothetical protein
MDQKKIMGLLLSLLDAITKNIADAETIRSVRLQFVTAAGRYSEPDPTDMSGDRLVSDLVGHVFDQAAMRNPASLPGLFPFLVAACADREDPTEFPDVDWDVLNCFLPQIVNLRRAAG